MQKIKLPVFFSRMVRAAILDIRLYEEVEFDIKTGRQAFLVVVLVSLAIGTGAGIAGMFKWAGLWSLWFLLIILVGSVLLWLTWSSVAYFTGTRLFQASRTSVTASELIRAVGFSASPGVLGFFLFIPVAGGFVWLGAILWTAVTGVVAVKQSLDFTLVRAILTWLVSWLVCLLIIIATITLLSLVLIDGNCTIGSDFDSRVSSITSSHRFSLTKWEVTTLPHELSQWIRGPDVDIDNDSDLVIEYASASTERKNELENRVESILENQVKEVLIEQGIYGFPPVNLKLDTMPRLLVISPRDRIESIREIMMQQELSLQERIDIEALVDELDVSSLVVQIGGFAGTYPSFVTNDAGLRYTIETAVEEWVHQYLAFKPLGFRYVLDVLGIARNYEIATMNETVADIVSEEICSIICDRYYPETEEISQEPSDFDLEMREIRLAVDDYLSRGEIEAAEEYMEQKRLALVASGYNLRKLNQAYFAWHGTYANEPAFISPIGVDLRQLRGQCTSVKDFLDTVSVMTGRQDLEKQVELTR